MSFVELGEGFISARGGTAPPPSLSSSTPAKRNDAAFRFFGSHWRVPTSDAASGSSSSINSITVEPAFLWGGGLDSATTPGRQQNFQGQPRYTRQHKQQQQQQSARRKKSNATSRPGLSATLDCPPSSTDTLDLQNLNLAIKLDRCQAAEDSQVQGGEIIEGPGAESERHREPSAKNEEGNNDSCIRGNAFDNDDYETDFSFRGTKGAAVALIAEEHRRALVSMREKRQGNHSAKVVRAPASCAQLHISEQQNSSSGAPAASPSYSSPLFSPVKVLQEHLMVIPTCPSAYSSPTPSPRFTPIPNGKKGGHKKQQSLPEKLRRGYSASRSSSQHSLPRQGQKQHHHHQQQQQPSRIASARLPRSSGTDNYTCSPAPARAPVAWEMGNSVGRAWTNKKCIAASQRVRRHRSACPSGRQHPGACCSPDCEKDCVTRDNLVRPPSRQKDAFPTDLTEFKLQRDAFKLQQPLVTLETQSIIDDTREAVGSVPRPTARHKPPSQSLFLEAPDELVDTSRLPAEASLPSQEPAQQSPSVTTKPGTALDQRHDDPDRDGFNVLEVEGPCPFRFEVTFSAFDEPSYDQAQADELPSWQQRNPGGMGSIPVQKGQHSESALSADAQGPSPGLFLEPCSSREETNADNVDDAAKAANGADWSLRSWDDLDDALLLDSHSSSTATSGSLEELDDFSLETSLGEDFLSLFAPSPVTTLEEDDWTRQSAKVLDCPAVMYA